MLVLWFISRCRPTEGQMETLYSHGTSLNKHCIYLNCDANLCCCDGFWYLFSQMVAGPLVQSFGHSRSFSLSHKSLTLLKSIFSIQCVWYRCCCLCENDTHEQQQHIQTWMASTIYVLKAPFDRLKTQQCPRVIYIMLSEQNDKCLITLKCRWGPYFIS